MPGHIQSWARLARQRSERHSSLRQRKRSSHCWIITGKYCIDDLPPLQMHFHTREKCAGSSIIHAFDLNPGNPDWTFMNDGVLSAEYTSAPAGYFRFSVIRNPWDRFIFAWKYCASTRHRSLHDVIASLPREGHDYRHLTRPLLRRFVSNRFTRSIRRHLSRS